ncbi:lipoprotein [Escherichia coli]|nr:lipoprotein [Escherichia coli]CBJ00724.1 putative phage protein [Escherichia coli ETEC H10407]
MTNALICAGPSGGVACHGAEGARVFAIYENFPGKIMSVLLEHNYLFFLISNP